MGTNKEKASTPGAQGSWQVRGWQDGLGAA